MMNKIRKLKRLGWLGIVGFAAPILGVPALQYMHLFFAFWLLGFKNPFRGNGFGIFFQSMLQLWGMIHTPFANKFSLPNKDNYVCKADYMLPFTGKWTVVNGGVDKSISHSWGVHPQRYAYDFIITDEENKHFEGEPTSLHSYFCYGRPIAAPADGEVVRVRAHHKDSRTDGAKVYCDATDISGNSIIIKHAEKEYSMTSHIMPNSILVKAGDKVKQGDIIAKCGNSGNTSTPHIHFQLMSGKNPFLSAGLPIAFKGISAQQKEGYAKLDPRPRDGNLQNAGGKIYIGRGLEAENK